MSPTVCAAIPACPSAAELNAAIRQFTAGRLVWSAEARAELAVLQAEWRDAVAREQQVAGAA